MPLKSAVAVKTFRRPGTSAPPKSRSKKIFCPSSQVRTSRGVSAHCPAAACHQRVGGLRLRIEAPHQRRGAKPGLRARQTASIGFVVPKKTRAAEAAVAAGSLQGGGMHNGDHVPGLGALKILIARGLQVI